MPRLVIERPGQEQQVFELPQDRPVYVGRAESNDLVLRETSVSRRHAMLSPSLEGSWMVRDLGSANGIFLNGKTVKETQLKDGDVLNIGEYSLRYESMESQILLTQAAAKLPPRLTMVMSLKDVHAALNLGKDPSVAPAPTPTPSAPSPRAPATSPAAERSQLESRMKALEHENRLFELLYQVSRALGDLQSVEEVVNSVLDLVLKIEGVERGYAMLADEKGGFQPAVIRYRKELGPDTGRLPQMILSQAIIKQVTQGGVPLLVQDVRMDPKLGSSKSIALSGMQSAMCAPLKGGDKLYGLLYVDNLVKRGMFSQEDLNIFSVIATQAGLAVDRVRGREEMAKQTQQRSALERFLSPGVAQKIAAEAADIQLRGETQNLTVLFADIRGFTSMSEKMTPEEIVEILNDFFNAMSDKIFSHEGTLDKFLGDGLMCLFGAPLSKGTDALNAVKTAVEMQQTLVEINKDLGRPLHMGIGINTGRAVVGYMGATRRMDYTAIGDVVNVASRLCATAAPDQILVSATTQAEFGGELPTRKLDPVKVKGKAEPIQVFEVLWQEVRVPSKQ
ncbi:MAG TPA: adenylate/guanylate cyclase domain-containing protein [Candidatus Acidoferrales bacterium]|nr:adenylate/guanylate cyclase domain-containing protein [Candidatus Acidoferrales bacterium]